MDQTTTFFIIVIICLIILIGIFATHVGFQNYLLFAYLIGGGNKPKPPEKRISKKMALPEPEEVSVIAPPPRGADPDIDNPNKPVPEEML